MRCTLSNSKLNKGLLKEFNSADKKDQGSLNINKSAKELVARFPIEPSGYLHIGHEKAALIKLYFSTREVELLRYNYTNSYK